MKFSSNTDATHNREQRPGSRYSDVSERMALQDAADCRTDADWCPSPSFRPCPDSVRVQVLIHVQVFVLLPPLKSSVLFD